MIDMLKTMPRLAGCIALLALSASTAFAQIKSVEIGGNVGYTLSEGVGFSNQVGTDGQTYNGLEPADAFSWGLHIGATGYQYYEMGFLWDRQESSLVANGLLSDKTVADMAVDNYHGYIGFNYARGNPAAVPFLFIGLGATSYGSIDLMGKNIGGETQFSTTWGAGVKIYPPNRPVGLRLQMRWTPTYIKTDPGGVWCDPYWGCYQTGDAEYSHALEFSGGVTFKFMMK